jgi:hypothetical protein
MGRPLFYSRLQPNASDCLTIDFAVFSPVKLLLTKVFFRRFWSFKTYYFVLPEKIGF